MSSELSFDDVEMTASYVSPATRPPSCQNGSRLPRNPDDSRNRDAGSRDPGGFDDHSRLRPSVSRLFRSHRPDPGVYVCTKNALERRTLHRKIRRGGTFLPRPRGGLFFLTIKNRLVCQPTAPPSRRGRKRDACLSLDQEHGNKTSAIHDAGTNSDSRPSMSCHPAARFDRFAE